MNWDALGATAELLGAIAVVVSMLILAQQIRESTRVAKAEAIRSHGGRMVDLWYRVAESERLMSAVGQALFEEMALEEMGEEQRRIHHCSIRGLAMLWESEFLENRSGALDDSVWDSRLHAISTLLEKPAYYAVWSEIRPMLTSEFVNEVEAQRSATR